VEGVVTEDKHFLATFSSR